MLELTQRWPTLLMGKLGRIAMHRFTQALEPHGLKPRHLAALIELRDQGELSLCANLRIDPTNLVEILNDLENRGYASRRRDPEDRRRHRVEVSKKGLAVIENVSTAMDSAEDDLLADFDADDRARLERLLFSMWERAAATTPTRSRRGRGEVGLEACYPESRAAATPRACS